MISMLMSLKKLTANPDYRSEKLKARLQRDKYSNGLSFCQLSNPGTCQTYLVYSSKIDTDSAIKRAYELGSTN